MGERIVTVKEDKYRIEYVMPTPIRNHSEIVLSCYYDNTNELIEQTPILSHKVALMGRTFSVDRLNEVFRWNIITKENDLVIIAIIKYILDGSPLGLYGRRFVNMMVDYMDIELVVRPPILLDRSLSFNSDELLNDLNREALLKRFIYDKKDKTINEWISAQEEIAIMLRRMVVTRNIRPSIIDRDAMNKIIEDLIWFSKRVNSEISELKQECDPELLPDILKRQINIWK